MKPSFSQTNKGVKLEGELALLTFKGKLAKLVSGEAKHGKRRVNRRKDLLKQEYKRKGRGRNRKRKTIFKCF